VVGDLRALEVHDFGEIDLVAGGGVAGVLPGQGLAVEQVAAAAVA